MNPKQIQLPDGFKYSGLATGIKKSRAPDLAIVAAESDCVAAGVYTQNLVRAASIDWNKKITPSAEVRAVVINSGNANACTGEQGIQDNQQIAVEASEQLGARPEQILVLSTGIIGHHLPMDKLSAGIKTAARELGSEDIHFDKACQAIMTTDSGKKTARRAIKLGASEFRIAGMAKGAGMIGPRMATLLCVIVTDAKLEKQTAQLRTSNRRRRLL